MKHKVSFLFAALLFSVKYSFSATYYVSASIGNDKYTNQQARNAATPWKSLNRVNAAFRLLSPGDSILFKKGEVFSGALVVSKSGTLSSPIYIGAYGKGDIPVITGSVNLQNWKQVQKGVFQAEYSGDGSNLFIGGVPQAMGRFPNAGYLSYESYSNSAITDNQLTGATNWTGAEVVIRKNRWVIDKSRISSHQGGTIKYELGNKANPTKGYGYFIQNDSRTLDQFGEWYFDKTRKMMLLFAGNRNPNLLDIRASVVRNLVEINRVDHITIENLRFTGAGNNAFNIVQSKRITLRNLVIDQTGAEAVAASSAPYLSISNSVITNALSGGLNLDIGTTNASIVNNLIKNIGLIPGAGKSGTGTYEAITSFGDNSIIEKNRIDSIGYNGIYFGGNSAVVKNNFISYFCMTKDDGAGIYLGDWTKTSNKKVIGNVVMHGIGNGAGTNYPSSLQAEGIYIDDNTQSVSVIGNTVSYSANNGIKVHNATDVIISENTVFNNGVQLRLEQDHYIPTSSYIRNNQITNNRFFSKESSQPVLKVSSHQNDVAAFGTMENNIYSAPKTSSISIRTSVVENGKQIDNKLDLSGWKKAYGKDKSSVQVNNSVARFEYNGSNTPKTIQLNEVYVDANNKTYKGKVRIEAYSSLVLFSPVAKFSLNKSEIGGQLASN